MINDGGWSRPGGDSGGRCEAARLLVEILEPAGLADRQHVVTRPEESRTTPRVECEHRERRRIVPEIRIRRSPEGTGAPSAWSAEPAGLPRGRGGKSGSVWFQRDMRSADDNSGKGSHRLVQRKDFRIICDRLGPLLRMPSVSSPCPSVPRGRVTPTERKSRSHSRVSGRVAAPVSALELSSAACDKRR